MILADWAKFAAIASVVLALFGGAVGWLERRLNQMGQAQEERAQVTRQLIEAVDHKVVKLDGDVDGLTQQLGSLRDDAQRRFLPRDEHTESVRQLREAMADLAQTMRDFSRQLFDLARARGPSHDSDRR